MLHVKKCPYGKRGRPTTEFYIDEKPQIYCHGWIDRHYDEPLEVCKKCPDWAYGEQCERDFEEARTKRVEQSRTG